MCLVQKYYKVLKKKYNTVIIKIGFLCLERKVCLVFTTDRNKVSSSSTGCFPTINSLYSMIPRETRLHMERVGRYSEVIFKYLYRKNPDMVEEELGSEFFKYSEEVFKYHDIGRFFIPVSILNKVDKLTDEEVMIIRDHTINALSAIELLYKKPFPREVLEHFLDVAVYHHERWDGDGYPERRMGTEIPLGARICAIADSFDGITSWKPYKKRQTTQIEAIDIITSQTGKQFDPYLIEVFTECSYNLLIKG